MPKQRYFGTTFDKVKNRWKARVTVEGRTVSLGYHNTQELAHAAVLDALAAPPEAPVLVVAEKPPLPVNHEALVDWSKQTKRVVQHNELVETPTTTTLLEARIFYLMLRCIRKGDALPQATVIPLEDLFPSGTYGGQQQQLLEAAMVRMMSATIRIPELNKDNVHLVSLCDSMRLDTDTKLLVATFGPAVLPYLVNLVGNFTTADVDELLAIKSHNTTKLYWLMRSWQFKSPHTVSVDQLRELTAGDAYPRYADFHRNVLKPSVAELNELSFDISYKEKRHRGKLVTSIQFTIGQKPSETETSAVVVKEKPKLQLTDLQQKVTTRLSKLKLTEAQVKAVLNVVVGEEQLKKLMSLTYPLYQDMVTKAKPNENYAATTMNALKSAFPKLYMVTA